MCSQEALLLLLYLMQEGIEKEKEIAEYYDNVYSMEYTNRVHKLSCMTQLIVTSKEFDELLKNFDAHVRIKYQLPMIQSYVIEVEEEIAKGFIQKNNDLMNLQLETDTILTVQMKRASEIIHLEKAHQQGICGEGVGVAVLDTGVSIHPDLVSGKNRIVAFYDVINGRRHPYDDNGHGTHVSGIIGGNGCESGGRYVGVAPKCNIIGVKVLNHKGNGNVTDVLAGLQWVIDHKERYNIRVVNISVGTTANNSIDENSLLVKGVDAVWDAGIVVVVAAGNNGPKPKSISTPGISRKIITVGASDDDIPVELGGSKTKDYSGRGPTRAAIKKPDVVAPGSNIVSCNGLRNNRRIMGIRPPFGPPRVNDPELFNGMYTIKSGTSMSTPMVSGAIALLLGKYPSMTTRDVKVRIKDSSADLGRGHEHQGWGQLDVEKMLGL